ncbi:Fungal trans [Geosmithia morbida]|uniref:Fungal trans n=1 Tax=Geosmithia morbida TaxID=1094350 RepID=A0A9P5CZB2_9HYPO|nr:Fungal trans [Geosmithia morbida]KAF4121383.1 Fungal trans [Geosmithia morbida]
MLRHRLSDAAVDFACSASTNSISPTSIAQAQRRFSSQHSPGATAALPLQDDDSDSGLDHLLFGVVTSPSARDDGSNSFPPPSDSVPSMPLSKSRDSDASVAHSLAAIIPPEIDDLLLGAYRDRAQAQYPFFHWSTFLTWVSGWKTCPPSELASRAWQGFFVNLVYATALLLLAVPRVGQSDARSFYRSGLSLLPHVFRCKDEILHVQAHLLLSINSLHRSSTPRILSLSSTTLRFCVQQQLHLAEMEPVPTTPTTRLKNQIRRRCFWSAYCIDRLIVASFELPPSLSDSMISTKLYNNIDDEDLEAVAASTPVGEEMPDAPVYTCVSPSLYVLQCRRIQSEISGYTLRYDYRENYEESSEWRVRILNELQGYKSRVQNFSNPESKGHASQRWLGMIYHYTLLLLYRPTKANVMGAAGDWAIQASSQACLIFRRSQMDRQIAQGWVGLLVQFQSGVTLLYCCWATPPEYRTENYDSPDVSDALRACSNILAIMADPVAPTVNLSGSCRASTIEEGNADDDTRGETLNAITATASGDTV